MKEMNVPVTVLACPRELYVIKQTVSKGYKKHLEYPNKLIRNYTLPQLLEICFSCRGTQSVSKCDAT